MNHEEPAPASPSQLDDEGFPPSFRTQSPPEAEEDHHSDAYNPRYLLCCNKSTTTSSATVSNTTYHGGNRNESDFASDFYASGSDWSRLLPSEMEMKNAEEREKKKLKQANLFQMWGYGSCGSSSKPNPPPPTKKRKKAFGDETDDTDETGTAAAGRGGRGPPRLCPFYKRIPGTHFTVDAFRYGRIEGCSAYFLTHFHYDHYGGLTKGWSHGPIYCTPLTARLIHTCISVNPLFIHPLELDTEHAIDGIKITFLEANHCPGAALIHFHLPDGRSCLHTGDFRASDAMRSYPLLATSRVSLLYLDTTYCNPKYKFPSKEAVLSFVVKVTSGYLQRRPKTLVIVGAYSIGKECVYLAIAEALGVKIYANASRRRILHSFGWAALSKNLCSHGKDTPLHVLPISSLRFETLKQYLETFANQYSAVLAFRPTGWTYSESVGDQLDLIKPNSKGNITIYGVPYSEHSSFSELRQFVQFLRPEKIIPTVNVGNAITRGKMQSYFSAWLKADDLGIARNQ